MPDTRRAAFNVIRFYETRLATPIDTQMFQNCYISMCQCNKYYLDIILICEDIVIEVLFKIRTYRSIANIF